MLKLKLAAIIGVLGFVGIALHNSHSFSATAENDALEEIAKYKTWTKISKEPIAVKIDESLFGGWNNLPFELLSSGSINQIVNTRSGATTITIPTSKNEHSVTKTKEKPKENDGFSFGVVYANDLARGEIEKEKPQFPVGSMIVWEKRAKADDETPQVVIAMVKREKGFSKKSGNWEFFTFNGADLKMQKRETKGDCAYCHAQTAKTDWVFRNYLK